MYHLNTQTTAAINEAFGAFELVGTPKSFEPFEGDRRTIYTVRKPSGTKCYQVMQFSNGRVIKMN
jgi:hypothetical protein